MKKAKDYLPKNLKDLDYLQYNVLTTNEIHGDIRIDFLILEVFQEMSVLILQCEDNTTFTYFVPNTSDENKNEKRNKSISKMFKRALNYFTQVNKLEHKSTFEEPQLEALLNLSNIRYELQIRDDQVISFKHTEYTHNEDKPSYTEIFE